MAKKIMMLTGSELHSVIKECINDIILWNAKNENTIHEQMVDEALIHSYEASVVIRHSCHPHCCTVHIRLRCNV